jgi:hypothetical protein
MKQRAIGDPHGLYHGAGELKEVMALASQNWPGRTGGDLLS